MTHPARLRVLFLSLAICAASFAYHHTTEDLMVSAANAFLASLNSNQKPGTHLKMDNPDFETWHFVPDNNFISAHGYARNGVTYRDMIPEQRVLADALIAASLSKAGFIRAKTIMSLEEVLRIKEKDTVGRRDVELYHVSIFGDPATTGSWGWRLEGHHISLHFLMKDGKLVSTSPTFFGANPHEVREGPRKGVRPLAAEEDVARKLIRSLDGAARKMAVIADKAPRDIVTAFSTRAKIEGAPQGIQASKLSGEQFKTLIELAEVYSAAFSPEQAKSRIAKVHATAKEDLYFAWAGSIEPGKGDYYRIQAPEFLIEYDNTQNENNHSHSVWRDYKGDFGRDVLAAHYQQFDHGFEVDDQPLAD